nr:hypothetical protein CFP56_50814 [Quercus suber]
MLAGRSDDSTTTLTKRDTILFEVFAADSGAFLRARFARSSPTSTSRSGHGQDFDGLLLLARTPGWIEEDFDVSREEHDLFAVDEIMDRMRVK